MEKTTNTIPASVGRIVHYHPPIGDAQAAIITSVTSADPDQDPRSLLGQEHVNLIVFPGTVGTSVAGVHTAATMYAVGGVVQSRAPMDGCWTWPPRV